MECKNMYGKFYCGNKDVEEDRCIAYVSFENNGKIVGVLDPEMFAFLVCIDSEEKK